MEWLSYLIKVSVCTGLFYAFYLLLLRKLTFFSFNRYYLLASLFASFLIPSFQFTVEREVQEVAYTNDVMLPVEMDLSQSTMSGSEIMSVVETPAQTFDWYDLMVYLYSTVAVAFVLVTVWKLFQLLKYAKYGKKTEDFTLVEKRTGFTNCSFFHFVFIDGEKLSPEEIEVLLQHESVHVKRYHSIDKLFLLVARAVLWFNPIIYLWNRELEQIHEFEADENTSSACGKSAYATLLLRLATSAYQMPLVHNFVKSPVKERIKMLFHTKSGNMKKLTYLLALPVMFGLTWALSIEVVYAVPQAVSPQETQQKIGKKELALPNKPQTDPYFNSPAYKALVKKSESLAGKVLTGSVGADFTVKRGLGIMNGKLFKVGEETYVIAEPIKNGLSALKQNDLVTVYVENVSFGFKDSYFTLFAKSVKKGNAVVYTKPIAEKHPFMYEVNKVRFNDPVITSVANSSYGKELKLKQNGYDFTVRITKAQTDNAEYIKSLKVGDVVRLRFVHEVKTGAKSYLINDWLSISKNVRSYGLQNEALFYRFYNQDGSQKIKSSVTTATQQKASIRPILRSSASARVDNKSEITYLKKGIIEIGDQKLEADEIAYDRRNETITAKDAVLTKKDGTVTKDDYIVYDLKKGSYKLSSDASSNIFVPSKAYQLLSKLNYQADSVKVNRGESVTILMGKIKLNIDNYAITAKIAEFDKHSNRIVAYLATLTSPDGAKVKSEVIEFDIVDKKMRLATQSEWFKEIRPLTYRN